MDQTESSANEAHISVAFTPGGAIIGLQGAFNAEDQPKLVAVAEELAEFQGQITLDVTEVEFLDASCSQVFENLATQHATRVFLVGASPTTLMVLTLTNVLPILNVEDPDTTVQSELL